MNSERVNRYAWDCLVLWLTRKKHQNAYLARFSPAHKRKIRWGNLRMRKTRSGERVRYLWRSRESLAGCRGAVLTRCFVAAGSMAVLQNIPCPSVHLFTPSDRYSAPGVIQVRRTELGFKGAPFGTRMCNGGFPPCIHRHRACISESDPPGVYSAGR